MHKKRSSKCSKRQEEDSKDYNQGNWTEHEHRLFEECYRKYGSQWHMFTIITTRSVAQIRSHNQKWQNKIKNMIQKEALKNIQTREIGGKAKTRSQTPNQQKGFSLPLYSSQDFMTDEIQYVREELPKKSKKSKMDNSTIIHQKKKKKEVVKSSPQEHTLDVNETLTPQIFYPSAFAQLIAPHLNKDFHSEFTMFSLTQYNENFLFPKENKILKMENQKKI